jgi:hypothetical protein
LGAHKKLKFIEFFPLAGVLWKMLAIPHKEEIEALLKNGSTKKFIIIPLRKTCLTGSRKSQIVVFRRFAGIIFLIGLYLKRMYYICNTMYNII